MPDQVRHDELLETALYKKMEDFTMKTISSLFALLVILFMTSGPLSAGEIKELTLKVEGMSCRLCAPAVKKAISGVEGVKSVHVGYEEKEARIQYEGDESTIDKMIKTVKDATGYNASVAKRGSWDAAIPGKQAQPRYQR